MILFQYQSHHKQLQMINKLLVNNLWILQIFLMHHIILVKNLQLATLVLIKVNVHKILKLNKKKLKKKKKNKEKKFY